MPTSLGWETFTCGSCRGGTRHHDGVYSNASTVCPSESRLLGQGWQPQSPARDQIGPRVGSALRERQEMCAGRRHQRTAHDRRVATAWTLEVFLEVFFIDPR